MPIARFFLAILFSLRTLFLALLASARASRSFSRMTSALDLWISSTKTFLFLNMLPLAPR